MISIIFLSVVTLSIVVNVKTLSSGTHESSIAENTILPDGNTRNRLKNVLYEPKLSYNLLSVSKATEAGNTTKFGCEIVDRK